MSPQYDDDGIGTSDDETNSNGSVAKTSDDLADDNVTECDDDDESAENGQGKSRRVIKPDMGALNRLLAFDEVRNKLMTF